MQAERNAAELLEATKVKVVWSVLQRNTDKRYMLNTHYAIVMVVLIS